MNNLICKRTSIIFALLYLGIALITAIKGLPFLCFISLVWFIVFFLHYLRFTTNVKEGNNKK